MINEITNYLRWESITIYPLLCYKEMNFIKIIELRKESVIINGEPKPVHSKKCGSYLLELF